MKRLVKQARKLRRKQTPEEARLWSTLRDRRLLGYKFRRQFPIDKYIVDFCCLKKRLRIELDGGQHNEKLRTARDEVRDEYLKSQNFRILRIWNNELGQNTEGVLQKVLDLLQ